MQNQKVQTALALLGDLLEGSWFIPVEQEREEYPPDLIFLLDAVPKVWFRFRQETQTGPIQLSVELVEGFGFGALTLREVFFIEEFARVVSTHWKKVAELAKNQFLVSIFGGQETKMGDLAEMIKRDFEARRFSGN